MNGLSPDQAWSRGGGEVYDDTKTTPVAQHMPVEGTNNIADDINDDEEHRMEAEIRRLE